MKPGVVQRHEMRRNISDGLFLLLLVSAIVMPLVATVSSTKDSPDVRSLFATESRASLVGPFMLAPGAMSGPTSKPDSFGIPSSSASPNNHGLRTEVSSSAAPIDPKPLANGVTATGILNGSDDSELWYIDVSSGARTMTAVLTCPYESPRCTDFDLYGRQSTYPTNTTYDWSAHNFGDDQIEVNSPKAGTWYILVFSWQGKGTYQLEVTVLYARNAKPLAFDTPFTGILNGTADSDLWYIDIPNWTYGVRYQLTCPNGSDFDLYGRPTSYPTTLNYTWRACSGGAEDLVPPLKVFGRWYIMPYSYRGNGTYQLTVTMQYPPPIDLGSVPIGLWFVLGASLSLLIFVVLLLLTMEKRTNRIVGAYERGALESLVTEEASREHRGGVAHPVAVHATICARCGASLEQGSAYCWNCGAAVAASSGVSSEKPTTAREHVRPGICMVCKNSLEKSDEMLFCPFCGSLAHTSHLLEWLHVKDYCPSCGRHLEEDEVGKQLGE
jgi:hypothetical protein